MVLWQRLATCSFAPGWAGNLQSVTVFLGILPFRCTCKALLFVKAAPILAKKVTAAISFSGRDTLASWTPRMVLPKVALKACFKQKPTLIHLRHAKSFVFRAARKVPHCQKWDCHALPLFALERAIPAGRIVSPGVQYPVKE